MLRYILTCLMALTLGNALAQDGQEASRKKVALVLSGGGAKGTAHIGVIKVLEHAGIPIDIVTGTSMGSIVGGLYAMGYDASTLDSIVRSQDWGFLLSDKEDLKYQSIQDRQKQTTYLLSKNISLSKRKASGDGGLMSGKNISDLFVKLAAGYNDSIDFNTLPIPFACVATNIIDNTEYDFHSGHIAQAMRASMAIPGAFSPVRIGDMVLVDGGLRNNYPADIAKQMGADYIIGVSVQGDRKTADDLTGMSSVLGQIVDINCFNKYSDNLAITDIPIRVNVKGYSTMSFSATAIDSLIHRGEEAAMQHWDQIVALRDSLGIGSGYVTAHHTTDAKARVEQPDRVLMRQIVFQNMTAKDEQFLRSKFKLREGDSIDAARADRVTTSMRVDLFYKDAYYSFEPGYTGSRVIFTAGNKKDVQLNVGMRFDSEEKASLQVNGVIPLRAKLPAGIDVTMRLGKRSLGRVDLSLHPRSFQRPTISYIIRHNDINLYYNGDKDYNLTYVKHALRIAPINFDVRNFNINIGCEWNYLHIKSLLVDHATDRVPESVSSGHYYQYSAVVSYISEDNWLFPTRGAKFDSRYAYVTDNLAKLDGHKGMSDLSAMWRMSFGMGKVTIQPTAYGRLLFGSKVPITYNNLIGGEWPGHYVEQQMPFAGIGNIEPVAKNFVGLQLQGQYRMTTNNYILLRIAAARHHDKLRHLADGHELYGISGSYYYNTMFGPVGGTVGYSNKTDKPYIYINLGFVF